MKVLMVDVNDVRAAVEHPELDPVVQVAVVHIGRVIRDRRPTVAFKVPPWRSPWDVDCWGGHFAVPGVPAGGADTDVGVLAGRSTMIAGSPPTQELKEKLLELGIDGVGRRSDADPARPDLGADCHRAEVDGKRLLAVVHRRGQTCRAEVERRLTAGKSWYMIANSRYGSHGRG